MLEVVFFSWQAPWYRVCGGERVLVFTVSRHFFPVSFTNQLGASCPRLCVVSIEETCFVANKWTPVSTVLLWKTYVFDDFDFLCTNEKTWREKKFGLQTLSWLFPNPKSVQPGRECESMERLQRERLSAVSESTRRPIWVTGRIKVALLTFQDGYSPGGQILAWQPRQVFSCACLSCLP